MVKNNRLIVFFIPPEKIVNGGILSIFSLCKVSREFKNIHKSNVVLSTYPGHKSYRRNDLFENDENIYTFDEVVQKGALESLQLHVPEYAAMKVFTGLKKYSDYLSAIPDLSVNIMAQNIRLMPKPYELVNWFSLAPEITLTTAHDRYANQDLANQYCLPTHHLSVYNDPDQYTRVPFKKKTNLIIFSPDETEQKKKITEKIKKQFPAFKIVTIWNMRYEKYKELISRAKFTLTFGEGFDGYYIEAFFSGGITFAVYNDDFFPDKEFSKFENTYSSYSEMLNNITRDMSRLGDSKADYESVVNKNLRKITKLYNFSAYKKNLENFYRHKLSFYPSPDSTKRLIADILAQRDRLLTEKDTAITEKDRQIAENTRSMEQQAAAIVEKDELIANFLNSRSWKVTKPLRKLSYILKKARGS